MTRTTFNQVFVQQQYLTPLWRVSATDLFDMVFEPFIHRLVEYEPFEESCSVIVYSRVSSFLAAELLSKFLELQDVKGQDPSGGGRSK
jgi:hypothetical protein